MLKKTWLFPVIILIFSSCNIQPTISISAPSSALADGASSQWVSARVLVDEAGTITSVKFTTLLGKFYSLLGDSGQIVTVPLSGDSAGLFFVPNRQEGVVEITASAGSTICRTQIKLTNSYPEFAELLASKNLLLFDGSETTTLTLNMSRSRGQVSDNLPIEFSVDSVINPSGVPSLDLVGTYVGYSKNGSVSREIRTMSSDTAIFVIKATYLNAKGGKDTSRTRLTYHHPFKS